MARNEDGEFELMVGNRQLLTIVFIIFVLCGIVFTMGYFVGRNSGPPISSAAVAKSAEPAGGQPSGGRSALAEPDSSASSQLEPGDAKVTSASQTPALPPAPETAKPAETAPAPQARQTSAPPARERESRRPEPSSAPGVLREPVPGQTYVQVAAVVRPTAETLADVLQKKAFPAFVAPGPNDTLFRVLVGPVKDAAGIAKLKADLEGVGIKDTRVKKY